MFTTKAVSHRWYKVALAAGTVALLGTATLAQANDVVALKHALYGAGYDIENVNSTLDDKTRAQLTQFQQDHGLDASGTLNEQTEQALGLNSVQQVVASSAQAEPEPAAPRVEDESEQPAASKDAGEEDEDDGWSLW